MSSRKFRALMSRLDDMSKELAVLRQRVPHGAVAIAAAKFEVIELEHDYNICRQFDHRSIVRVGNENTLLTEGHNVKVMRHWDVRKTGWHGVSRPDHNGDLCTYAHDDDDTQQRTKTRVSDGEEEIQNIVPRYVPRQTIGGTVYHGTILAALLIVGGVGAFGEYYKVDEGTASEDIPIWIDVGPWAWALANE